MTKARENSDYTGLQGDLALKSPVASPVFTGNVGVGVIPEAGWSSYSALQIGGTGSLFSSTAAVGGSATQFANNAYRDGSGNYKYIITDEASRTYQESGSHVFQVAPSGSADAAISWTTGLQVLNDGKARVPNGLLFGTDTAAANTLDDYEEGTWTPAFGRNGGTQPSVVYNEQVGSYTKVGNMVFLTGDMGVNSISIPSNGTLTITGMPFTKSSAHNPTGSFTSSQFNLYRARGQLVHVDNTKLGFLGQASATGQGGWDWEPVSALDGNESLRFAITYQV